MRMNQPIYVLVLNLSAKTYESQYLNFTFKRKQLALGSVHCCFKTEIDHIFGFSTRNKLQSADNYFKLCPVAARLLFHINV